MFTGLIEELGTIVELKKEASNLNIRVQAKLVLDDLKLGDSISIDGVCQTITEIEPEGFWVTAVAETLKLTNFNYYREGTQVNLERCLRLMDRIGGHLVQGHVDSTASLESIRDVNGSYELEFELPQELLKYVIYKGSIAINGISLTIAALEENIIKVCIIPKTWEMTNLARLREGDMVNIEVDQYIRIIRDKSSVL